MSYDIWLEDPKTKQIPKLSEPLVGEGGTFAVGGSTDAELNVTYNYCRTYRFSELKGKTAKETINSLERAVRNLGTERSNDYWEPTPGNVGHACEILLNMAQQFPDYVWNVS